VSPFFQAGNVYIPKRESKPWVSDYIDEMINFPNATHDDVVDATSQAINRLQGTLFEGSDEVIGDTKEGAIHIDDDYRIGLIPARSGEYSVIVVYNVTEHSIVYFQRRKFGKVQEQIDKVFALSVEYEAVIRAQAGIDDSILKVLERRGSYVRRVTMHPKEWALAYENLALLISYKHIKLPNDPELLAELEVFKSETHFDGQPDYKYQAGQNSAVRALCLVTHDVHALEARDEIDPDLIFDDPHMEWNEDEEY
jgi:hypothetical protein